MAFRPALWLGKKSSALATSCFSGHHLNDQWRCLTVWRRLMAGQTATGVRSLGPVGNFLLDIGGLTIPGTGQLVDRIVGKHGAELFPLPSLIWSITGATNGQWRPG